MKTRKVVNVLALVVSVVILAYIGAFVWCFDVTSGPVKDNKQVANQDVWLGPVIRGDSSVIGVGSGFIYQGKNYSIYRNFRPLCAVWLWLMKSE